MFDLDNFFMNGGFERAILERKNQVENGEVLTDKIGDYTIDSCYTFNAGCETAIWYKSNPMVIVEYYASKEQMAIGHQKWCEFCKNNPKTVYSVQLHRQEKLR